MKTILIRIPSFSTGNIGDTGLIKTIKNMLKDYNLILPTSDQQLNSIKLYNIDSLIYFGNDCVAYYSISTNIIKKFLRIINKYILLILLG